MDLPGLSPEVVGEWIRRKPKEKTREEKIKELEQIIRDLGDLKLKLINTVQREFSNFYNANAGNKTRTEKEVVDNTIAGKFSSWAILSSICLYINIFMTNNH